MLCHHQESCTAVIDPHGLSHRDCLLTRHGTISMAGFVTRTSTGLIEIVPAMHGGNDRWIVMATETVIDHATQPAIADHHLASLMPQITAGWLSKTRITAVLTPSSLLSQIFLRGPHHQLRRQVHVAAVGTSPDSAHRTVLHHRRRRLLHLPEDRMDDSTVPIVHHQLDLLRPRPGQGGEDSTTLAIPA
jgi:hypothetical protein